MSKPLCTRNNPYTCPDEPHTHDPKSLAQSFAFDREAFEWTMKQMNNPHMNSSEDK